MTELRYRLNGERVDFLTDALRAAGLPVSRIKTIVYNQPYLYGLTYKELFTLSGDLFTQFEKENGSTNPRLLGRLMVTEDGARKILSAQDHKQLISRNRLENLRRRLYKVNNDLDEWDACIDDADIHAQIIDVVNAIDRLCDGLQALKERQ